MIKKRGTSWWVVVYAGLDPLTGRKRQKTGTARTRAEARQLEARLISEVAVGKHKGAATKTVADLLAAWLDWRQGVRPISPNTLANYQRYIEQKIQPALGQHPITRVEAATIDRCYGLLRREGDKGGRPMSASAIHDVHAVLSGAFRQAMVWAGSATTR